MNTVLTIAIFAAVIALFAVVGAVSFYILRVRSIASRVGSFQCQYRPDAGAGWTTGIAVYGANTLDWYRLVSLSTKPDRSWGRIGMSVTITGEVTESDTNAPVCVGVSSGSYRAQLLMPASDYSGLVSWAEAAPPTPYGIPGV